MGELSETIRETLKKCQNKYGLFRTTTQAQKVTLNMINAQRRKRVGACTKGIK